MTERELKSNLGKLKNFDKSMDLYKKELEKLKSQDGITQEVDKRIGQRINEIEEKICSEMEQRYKLEDLIFSLPEEEREVMTLRYIENYNWDDLPKKIFISRSKCFQLQKNALKLILKEVS